LEKNDMDSKDDFKEELLKEITLTEQRLKSLREHVKPVVSDRSHGRMGKIDAILDKNLHESNIKSLENRLYQLKSTLSNIDNPKSGICKYCFSPIAEERRRALPETDKCIKCAARVT
jgi:DnaK suppressor protein